MLLPRMHLSADHTKDGKQVGPEPITKERSEKRRVESLLILG